MVWDWLFTLKPSALRQRPLDCLGLTRGALILPLRCPARHGLSGAWAGDREHPKDSCVDLNDRGVRHKHWPTACQGPRIHIAGAVWTAYLRSSPSSNGQTRRKAGTESHGPTALTSLRRVAWLPKGWSVTTVDQPVRSGWFGRPASLSGSLINARASAQPLDSRHSRGVAVPSARAALSVHSPQGKHPRNSARGQAVVPPPRVFSSHAHTLCSILPTSVAPTS
jgi:hypothetical protein